MDGYRATVRRLRAEARATQDPHHTQGPGHDKAD